METMWAPWRSEYINSNNDADKPKKDICVFCDALTTTDDHERHIIYRGKGAFVILNKFPYNNGHMLVMPNRHISRPDMMTDEERYEIMNLIVKAQTVLCEVYHPQGVNIGANIGEAAGAGIAQHMHFHVLPRWNADANFMTTVANTRVIPESLDETWEKIRKAWN
ncbi:MAG: HIT domain-containing protein [Anaerolineaceae bacterium]|nr:HIT domain-containing protein [Anaerolineaceae bacterium]